MTPEPDDGSPRLDAEERAKAQEAAPLQPKVIHEVIREEGGRELERRGPALFWSGLAGGLSMGFSFLGLALLQTGLPEAPWRHLVSAFGYTLGFLIVILGRQQLFTESTLTPVLPVLTQRDPKGLGDLLRLWSIVLIANLLGTWLFASFMTIPGVVDAYVRPAMLDVASHAFGDDFLATAAKAAIAGWLIATCAWMLPAAGSARVLVIVIVTWAVALGRFNHVIAGSVEAAWAVLTGAAGASDYLLRFLLPTLLGNTIGGVVFVAMLNHAPVKEEVEEGGR